MNIPFLEFIIKNQKFPAYNFTRENKKLKKIRLIYSLLSADYIKDLSQSTSYFFSDITYDDLQKKIEILKNNENRYLLKKQEVITTTVSIPKLNYVDTYVFIFLLVNNKPSINILQYHNTDLISWLGGIIENENDIHVSVKYNIDNDEIFRIIKLFYFFLEIKNIQNFETIICKPSQNDRNQVAEIEKSIFNIRRIDTSNLRDYFVPSFNRKEHFRWQMCGPGRTILKQVKIRETNVKEYIRKGKRIS